MREQLRHYLKSRQGLTLIELLVFAAIASVVLVAFMAILTSFTRVQVRQLGLSEVNQQSQFLLQTIQRYVEESSMIDVSPKDAATNTLKLWVPSSTTSLGASDFVYIFLSSSTGPGIIYVGTSTNPASADPLTNSRVTVSNLRFIPRSHPGGHDSVDVSFMVANNTQATEQRFSESLQFAVSRVSAASFDSNLLPTGIRDVGVLGNQWRSINEAIYFNGSNVGINISPLEALHVNGGFMLQPVTSPGTCAAANEGTVRFVNPSGGGNTSTLQVCAQNSLDAYAWQLFRYQ